MSWCDQVKGYKLWVRKVYPSDRITAELHCIIYSVHIVKGQSHIMCKGYCARNSFGTSWTGVLLVRSECRKCVCVFVKFARVSMKFAFVYNLLCAIYPLSCIERRFGNKMARTLFWELVLSHAILGENEMCCVIFNVQWNNCGIFCVLGTIFVCLVRIMAV